MIVIFQPTLCDQKLLHSSNGLQETFACAMNVCDNDTMPPDNDIVLYMERVVVGS